MLILLLIFSSTTQIFIPLRFLRIVCLAMAVGGAYKLKELFVAGQDKVKGNSFGNVNFFIFGEGKGAPIQN